MPNTKIFRGTNPCLLASEEVQGICPHWMPAVVEPDTAHCHPHGSRTVSRRGECVCGTGGVLPVLVLKNSGDVVQGWDGVRERTAVGREEAVLCMVTVCEEKGEREETAGGALVCSRRSCLSHLDARTWS